MPACFCPSCCDDPAATYTEAYRAECEAAMVAEMTSRDERRRYLAMVRMQRGAVAARELRDQSVAKWGELKAHRASV